ncbi:MAG: hypothetical protein H0W82_02230 [Actinobacteria bacterium]|nr:hypothetical protein [Actinomycetota bacterium]
MNSHTITVEPAVDLNRGTRRLGLPGNPDHLALAVVERGSLGRLSKVVLYTDDYTHACGVASGVAKTYGADFVTSSSYAPTVVGEDIARGIVAARDRAVTA